MQIPQIISHDRSLHPTALPQEYILYVVHILLWIQSIQSFPYPDCTDRQLSDAQIRAACPDKSFGVCKSSGHTGSLWGQIRGTQIVRTHKSGQLFWTNRSGDANRLDTYKSWAACPDKFRACKSSGHNPDTHTNPGSFSVRGMQIVQTHKSGQLVRTNRWVVAHINRPDKSIRADIWSFGQTNPGRYLSGQPNPGRWVKNRPKKSIRENICPDITLERSERTNPNCPDKSSRCLDRMLDLQAHTKCWDHFCGRPTQIIRTLGRYALRGQNHKSLR